MLFIDAGKHFELPENQNKLREKDIEHIVSTYRDFTAGKLKAGILEDKQTYDYLVLLGIMQSCRFQKKSFLKFLLSGKKSI